MTLFGLLPVSQKNKKKWIDELEIKLREEFRLQIEAVQENFEAKKSKILEDLNRNESELILKQRDVEDLLKRFNDKKLELERKNNELSDQIRLIEAKASPDAVWSSAFQAGFMKCWETMWDFQAEQVIGLKEKIRTQAINETLGRLNGNLLPKTK